MRQNIGAYEIFVLVADKLFSIHKISGGIVCIEKGHVTSVLKI